MYVPVRAGILIAAVVLLLFTPPLSARDDPVELPKGLQGISIGGVTFISYTAGEDGGEQYSQFFLNRGYVTVKKQLFPFMTSRITFDTNQDGEGDGEGDMEVRLKYAFTDIQFGSYGLFRKTHVEFGIVHAVWLDFEEHINRYRMIGPMFMERSGIFNSADFGITFAGDFGPQLDDEYKEKVADKYAGQYGGFALGFYNGGGYHAIELNRDKVAEARLTLRPLPDVIPGLQVSGLLIHGRGNKPGDTDEIPLWQTTAGFLSYQHPYATLTWQYVTGWGNQKGGWTQAADSTASLRYEGYSLFVEGKVTEHWRVIGGYDVFDLDPATDNGRFTRYGGGVGYDFGNQNILILDTMMQDYAAETVDDDVWGQLTLQLHY